MSDEPKDSLMTPEVEALMEEAAKPLKSPEPDLYATGPSEAATAKPSDEELPEEKPSEPTAFEKLIAQTEDADDRVAMIQRAIDSLPEGQREKLPALQAKLMETERAKQQTELRAAEAGRQAQIAEQQGRIGQAESRIREHLTDVLKRARDLDTEEAPEYDGALINNSMDEIVKAEVYLQGQETRQLFSQAVLSRIHNLGDPISPERYQEMARWADSEEGRGGQGMVGAYLNELIARAKAQGHAAGLQEGEETLERFKKVELRAYLNEQMRKEKLEPDVDGTRPRRGPGKPEEVTHWSDRELAGAVEDGSIFDIELENIQRAKAAPVRR